MIRTNSQEIVHFLGGKNRKFVDQESWEYVLGRKIKDFIAFGSYGISSLLKMNKFSLRTKF